MISEIIIKKAQNKDIESLKTIYDEFKAFVWHTALKITKNEHNAEDVTSQVFIKIFDNIKKYRYNLSFKSWVYKIAINTIFNYLKKEKFRHSEELHENIGKNNKDSSEIKNFEQKDLVNKLLDELDETSKLIVILKDMNGLNHQEISDALFMNINTVKTNLSRARDKIRQKYLKEVQEYVM